MDVMWKRGGCDVELGVKTGYDDLTPDANSAFIVIIILIVT